MRKEVDYRELGLKIKEMRMHRGYTQDALAEMVGCNTSHISNIENCYTKLSLNVLLAIANALGTSVDYLLSNQLNDSVSPLDSEIMRALQKCDDSKKEKILKMIEIM